MTRGKLWGYVASGAWVFGAFGGADGSGRSGGAGRDATDEAVGPFHPGVMAGPRMLSRPELERLRWTGRQAGCEPQARHVQVADVVRRVAHGGGRAAAVTVRLAPGLPVVAGDARRLEAALGGLVDHAIRRSPLGARVLVRTSVVTAPALPRLGLGGASYGRQRGRVEIRVSDRGACGLPEAREWLLAGVRADGPVGPLHSLVLASGGRLAVEATPGGGLTVVLILAVAYD
ncbi:ATP-binding protein [Streptomyces kaniharaensis]|uniref:ATP-binding protein n=1 Tax=Streptomyces kaniharaensis TaxID=212423 RepID=A0A6N7KYI0_9ACTN|nr:ATP-binding protein [Streptomyces kaniharaensis]MQS15417.1 ATP-binding protein [Streptomyces kaniharaensis]